MSNKKDNARTMTSQVMKQGHMFDLGTMPESEDTKTFTQDLMKNLNQDDFDIQTENDNSVRIVTKVPAVKDEKSLQPGNHRKDKTTGNQKVLSKDRKSKPKPGADGFSEVIEGVKITNGSNDKTGINALQSDKNKSPFAIFADQDEDEGPKIKESNSDKLLGDDRKSLDLLLDQPENQASTRRKSAFNDIHDNIVKTAQKQNKKLRSHQNKQMQIQTNSSKDSQARRRNTKFHQCSW